MTTWLPFDELRKLSPAVDPKRIRFIVMGTQLSGYESGVLLYNVRPCSRTSTRFEVNEPERSEVVAFVTSLEPEIVEA